MKVAASAAPDGAHKTEGNSRARASAPKPAVPSFAELAAGLDYLDAAGIEQVRQAYRFADEAHLGQLRNNGQPYITHPIAVATQCAQWRLDAPALMAALLHDVLEDCGVTKPELIERFGAPVAELVDGLTKLDRLHFNTREESQAESFRKMLLAMARDVRVILIKLADRSHNMRTLSDVPREKWARTARETLDIYAPIAHRLGLNQTYRELQDLSLRHLHPWRYQILTKALLKARGRKRDLLQKVQRQVETSFAAESLKMRLAGREKSLFSVYVKMKQKHLSFAHVSDIYGFRVIVPLALDCYTALGILHQLYKPVPGKFKDHIAIAKLNGYQSLHTTVVGPAGVSVEFQMRTEAMEQGRNSALALDGSENTSVKYALCCRPIPGEAIVGYLGRGEGLMVHSADCAVVKRLQHKDSERFTPVEWSEDLQRSFETGIVVTVTNGKGVLARVAAAPRPRLTSTM